MYLYISFLRPPPEAISLAGSISITPQISNDLRTEPFAGSQDIYYSWSQETTTSRSEAIVASKALKLTTYRSNSAYKSITVPPPHGARAGQSWRLALTAQASGTSHIINLMGEKVGLEPLPVMSMPIMFGQRGGAGQKQEQIERMYRMVGPGEAGNIFMLIREQTSFDLDKVLFDSQ